MITRVDIYCTSYVPGILYRMTLTLSTLPWGEVNCVHFSDEKTAAEGISAWCKSQSHYL